MKLESLEAPGACGRIATPVRELKREAYLEGTEEEEKQVLLSNNSVGSFLSLSEL